MMHLIFSDLFIIKAIVEDTPAVHRVNSIYFIHAACTQQLLRMFTRNCREHIKVHVTDYVGCRDSLQLVMK